MNNVRGWDMVGNFLAMMGVIMVVSFIWWWVNSTMGILPEWTYRDYAPGVVGGMAWIFGKPMIYEMLGMGSVVETPEKKEGE